MDIPLVTIFVWRSVSTDGTMLYSTSSYQQSYRIQQEHAFIYATKEKKEEEIEIT